MNEQDSSDAQRAKGRSLAQKPSPGWDRQTFMPEKPHLWIQWKGSDICADMHCACGELLHIDDGTFLYYVRCASCQATYFVNGHVELVPLTDEETREVERGNCLTLVSNDAPFDTADD